MLPQSSGYKIVDRFFRNFGAYIYQAMRGFALKERAILISTALKTSNLKQVCNYIVFFRVISEGMIVFGRNCYTVT